MDHARRRAVLGSALSKKRIGAFLVTSPESRRYLSGFTGEDMGCKETAGLVLVLKNNAYLFTDGRFAIQARHEAVDMNVIIYKNGLESALNKVLRQTEVKRVGFEGDSIGVNLFERIKKVCRHVEFIPLDDLILRYRLAKDPQEIEAIKEAVKRGERAFEEALHEIRPGMTEKEAAWTIMQSIYKHSEGPSFPPIVASGPNSALPHATPGQRVIGEDEPVIIDMGVRILGYASDMTRTIFFGEPKAQFREIYACVKAAKEEAQKNIRAGMTGKEGDAIARRIIKEAGYGNYFNHSLGHGVGLSVHEPPMLSQRYRRRLCTNSIVTIEPGIYIPGEGGVRLEDMAIIREDSVELLGSGRWIYEF